MPHDRSLVPRDADAAAMDASASAGGYGLPPDLLAGARGRLRVMTLVFIALSVVSIALWPVGIIPGESIPLHAAALAISTTLHLIARSGRVRDTRALDAALVMLVAYSLLVSIGVARLMWLESGVLPEATWTCIMIVAIPLIVPAPPRRMLLAAGLSAATVPLGIAVVEATTTLSADAREVVTTTLSPAFCVVLAYFGARLVHGIGRDVARARQLGAYQLEARVGEGGMGEVWRARHRLLARPAAIKLIRSDILGGAGTEHTPRAVARFEREAQVTASLESPHTVRLYDFGVTDDGTLYYVMELLDGLDLEALLASHGPQPAARVIHIARQICHSLREAHAAGLVHRDIKTSNVFLCRRGGDFDVAKVVDFGLVGLREGPAPELRQGLTLEGQTPGTPATMAPEAVTGADVGPRADLYAVGCVMFRLLTGRHVFEAENALQLLLAHVNRPPVAPSTLAELDVPPELDALVLQCLAKDPAGRPSDAGALREALAAVPMSAPWTHADAVAWWRRL